jgi:Protein of unknown function (DUF3311)
LGALSLGAAPRERIYEMRRWYLLLAVPFLGLLYPPLYATEDPELFGFPFFYWYQFAWVPLTAGLTYFVYRMTRSREPAARRATGRFRRT